MPFSQLEQYWRRIWVFPVFHAHHNRILLCAYNNEMGKKIVFMTIIWISEL